MSEVSRRRIPPKLTPAELDGLAWPCQTQTLRALDFTFTVRTTSSAVADYLDGVLEAFPPHTGEPSTTYSIMDLGDDVSERWQGYYDAERFASTADPSGAVRYLLWHVNRRVVEETPRLTLVHAGGVELDGRGIVMPAAMESGKTTTTAGLLRRGMHYLSDEIVAIDPGSLALLGYPKALTVEPGSYAALAELSPTLRDGHEAFARERWDLRPMQIGERVIAERADPVLVVAPKYVSGATSRLDPIGLAETAMVLATSTFELERSPARDLVVLGRLARQCAGYRLTIGDLDEACDLVLDLLAQT